MAGSDSDSGTAPSALREQLWSARRRLRQIGRAARERTLGPLMAPLRTANVVMFHVGRSGSTVLGDLIGQHPRVYWDGEIYEHRALQRFEAAHGRIEYGSIAYRFDPIQLLKSRMPCAGRQIYGFEAKFFHLDYTDYDLDTFLTALRSLGFEHFIVLERRNLLRKIASSVAAHARAEFHIKSSVSAAVNRVHIPVDAVRIDRDCRPLAEFLAAYSRDMARLKQALATDNALMLSYEEDIAGDPRRAYEKVCQFLALPTHETQVRLARTNPFPLSEMLENFDEVSAALRGTEFAWMLDD